MPLAVVFGGYEHLYPIEVAAVDLEDLLRSTFELIKRLLSTQSLATLSLFQKLAEGTIEHFG